MFCRFCGLKLDESTHFCPNCGHPSLIAESGTDTLIVSNSPSDIIKRIEECRIIVAPLQEKYDTRNKYLISSTTKLTLPSLFGLWMLSGFIAGFLLLSFLGFFGLLLGWVGIGLVMPSYQCAKIKNAYNYVVEQYTQLNAELKEFYSNQSFPMELAYEYSDPRIIDVLSEILVSGKATTIKEAIAHLLSNHINNMPENTSKQECLSLQDKSFVALQILLNMKNNP